MDINLRYQVDVLVAKIKHYLITTMGRVNEQASDEEFYRAFTYALREEVMINWLATYQTMHKSDLRTLHYLSMEYLPGRLLANNLLNIGAQELILHVMQRMNRSYFKILFHEPDPGLGNGGLGRLASCFLDSLSTHHYPVKAYGLRYQYGIFEQQFQNGEQIEAPDCWLLKEYPWEFRRDFRKTRVQYCGQAIQDQNIHGDDIYHLENNDEVWAIPYDLPIVGYNTSDQFSVLTLRLWTTKESPRNFQLQKYNAGRLDQAAENTALTDVLYPSDWHEAGKRTRLKQEFLLVSASLQDIIRSYLSRHNHFRNFADKVAIQINDTHPALVLAELTRILIHDHDIPWKTAVDITRAVTGYTNHTILSEALEKWDQGLMWYLLPRQLKVIERLNEEFCNEVRVKYPGDEERVQRMSIIEKGDVRMAHLSIVGSHSINGVAALHTEILKKDVFKDFYEMYPDRFYNVTNGVTQRRWLLHCNQNLSALITKKIGDGWITNFEEIAKLKEFAGDPGVQQEFLDIKRKNKERLFEAIEFVKEHFHFDTPVVDFDSIFDMQIKRFHEYKRQLLNVLHTIMLYQEICENPKTLRESRTVIFAGKAAASYETAKNIIRLIHAVARKVNRDSRVKGLLKIVFIPNYNVSNAGFLIPAADLSEQISTAGMEASGTGNMKFTINGALTIGTRDGANIEMEEKIGSEYWPFSFGCSSEEVAQMKQEGTYQPWNFLQEDPEILNAVNTLQDRTFAETDEEHEAFSQIYRTLLEAPEGSHADQYFVLKDLRSYYDTQLKVEQLYARPLDWAEMCLHNIAGMGYFSTDRSVKDYAEKIWKIEPFLPDEAIRERISTDFKEADRCRIY